jgi:hypothetical protein
MRTFALLGAAMAISMMAPNMVWAWSTEQPAQQGSNSTNLADPLLSEDKLKDLEGKVQMGTSSQSGFFVSGGVNQPTSGLSGFQTNPLGTAPSTFSYSPNPGFRSRD